MSIICQTTVGTTHARKHARRTHARTNTHTSIYNVCIYTYTGTLKCIHNIILCKFLFFVLFLSLSSVIPMSLYLTLIFSHPLSPPLPIVISSSPFNYPDLLLNILTCHLPQTAADHPILPAADLRLVRRRCRYHGTSQSLWVCHSKSISRNTTS